MISQRSPLTPTKWGISIIASGSVQRTSSRSPGAKDFRALRVLSAGRGHFSPESHHGLEIGGIYWHFVDVMWIVVFFTVYIL